MSHQDQQYEEMLRRALHAAADGIEPAGDGLERIRARLSVPYPLPLAWLGAALSYAFRTAMGSLHGLAGLMAAAGRSARPMVPWRGLARVHPVPAGALSRRPGTQAGAAAPRLHGRLRVGAAMAAAVGIVAVGVLSMTGLPTAITQLSFYRNVIGSEPADGGQHPAEDSHGSAGQLTSPPAPDGSGPAPAVPASGAVICPPAIAGHTVRKKPAGHPAARPTTTPSPVPSPSPSTTPSATPTATPTPTASPSPTPTPTPTATPTATPAPTATPSPGSGSPAPAGGSDTTPTSPARSAGLPLAAAATALTAATPQRRAPQPGATPSQQAVCSPSGSPRSKWFAPTPTGSTPAAGNPSATG